MMDIERDVDKVWAAMLDDPAPPLPTARETLALARGASRRRTALAVAWSGLAGAVVIASATAGLTYLGAGGSTPAVPDPVAAPPGVHQQQRLRPLPAAPGRDAAHAHAEQTGAVLMAAIPTGYSGLLLRLSTDSPAATWQFPDPTQYSSSVDVILTTGQADGMLKAEIRGGLTGLGDDLCSASVTSILAPDLTGCDIVTLDGVQIRTSSTHDDQRGDVNTAVRLLDGGLLIVQAQQRVPAYQAGGDLPPDASVPPPDGKHTILGGWPALSAVPLTTAQLATLAVNPGLLP